MCKNDISVTRCVKATLWDDYQVQDFQQDIPCEDDPVGGVRGSLTAKNICQSDALVHYEYGETAPLVSIDPNQDPLCYRCGYDGRSGGGIQCGGKGTQMTAGICSVWGRGHSCASKLPRRMGGYGYYWDDWNMWNTCSASTYEPGGWPR